MQILKVHRSPVIYIAVALVPVTIGTVLQLGNSVKWVGRTDLLVQFCVTDAETGQPVSNATVGIRAEAGGFYDACAARRFTIATDTKGIAQHLCTNCMCFGSRSAFEDTYVVHLPDWWFHAKASGYSEAEPEYLNQPVHIVRVQRGKPSATLSVPIQLRQCDPVASER